MSIDYADELTGADDAAVLATPLSAAASVDFDFGADAVGIENITLDVAAIDVGGASTVNLDADLAGCAPWSLQARGTPSSVRLARPTSPERGLTALMP